MNTDDKAFINAISHRLDGFSWKSNEVAWCRCPVCGDSAKSKTKKRFYMYPKHGRTVCFCHNCNYSSTLIKFLQLYFPDVYREYIVSLMKFEEPDKTEPIVKHEKFCAWDFSICKKIIELPKEHFVRKYIDRRMIPYDKVLYCSNVNKILPNSEKISNPVPTLVIPYWKRWEAPEVFQIRFFDPKRIPKYLTFKQTEKSRKIYNLDFVDQSEPVYVTEGPIDAMMLKNAIAVGGSNLEIASRYVSNPVFVYDNEPRSQIICKKIWKIIKRGQPVVIFPDGIKFKDLNDMKAKGNIDVNKLVRENTFQGLNAELCFLAWKKCRIYI